MPRCLDLAHGPIAVRLHQFMALAYDYDARIWSRLVTEADFELTLEVMVVEAITVINHEGAVCGKPGDRLTITYKLHDESGDFPNGLSAEIRALFDN